MRKISSKEKDLQGLVERLVATCQDNLAINHLEGHDLPDRGHVFAALDLLLSLLFPGFLDGHPITISNLPYHIGDLLHHILIDLTREVEQAFRYACRVTQCEHCDVHEQAQKAVQHLLEQLPQIRETLKLDVQAGFDGDPAAKSLDEIILCYPAIEAIATHRLAHELYRCGVPLLPRMWSERAHSRTGIDIHPGATIGPRFFIDHGTGVVIGETAVIGAHVQLYQGVTLGALAPAQGQVLAGKKRHPTIEDDVIIYAGATILGGETVIGRGSIIGGNVWLTESVPPHTKVMLAKRDLVFLPKRANDKKGRAIRSSQPETVIGGCPSSSRCNGDNRDLHPDLSPPCSETLSTFRSSLMAGKKEPMKRPSRHSSSRTLKATIGQRRKKSFSGGKEDRQ